ncbi:prolyl aminopeptidase [Streptomyces oceani]|uniref:Proline iminopeptidase n=1 Tax=Streptomyces oceani TaxID=1075402 RepID=A0A1E7KQI1_9ACTN|nr:proline iminopeptidase [Streptomyces oceani]
MLDVGDGNLVYWEACGNPQGKPAVVVHGGPGSGRAPGIRRWFDPERYRLVLFDQRGCGRSTPHASDPATDLSVNTTEHLIADMELLRARLGIDRWLLFGGSWGSTLILAYAERHPERASEIVLSGVTTTRRAEIDWLYGGVGRFFPEAWERFRAGAGLHEARAGAGRGGRACGDVDTGELVGAYARLVSDPDPDVRDRATEDWCAWEDAVLSMEPKGVPAPFTGRPSAARRALVRIATHYFAHGAWLPEGALLRDAGRLAGIPGMLFHGRLDLGSPVHTAWELARAWPDARLVVTDTGGHLGSAAMDEQELATLDALARG